MTSESQPVVCEGHLTERYETAPGVYVIQPADDHCVDCLAAGPEAMRATQAASTWQITSFSHTPSPPEGWPEVPPENIVVYPSPPPLVEDA